MLSKGVHVRKPPRQEARSKAQAFLTYFSMSTQRQEDGLPKTYKRTKTSNVQREVCVSKLIQTVRLDPKDATAITMESEQIPDNSSGESKD